MLPGPLRGDACHDVHCRLHHHNDRQEDEGEDAGLDPLAADQALRRLRDDLETHDAREDGHHEPCQGLRSCMAEGVPGVGGAVGGADADEDDRRSDDVGEGVERVRDDRDRIEREADEDLRNEQHRVARDAHPRGRLFRCAMLFHFLHHTSGNVKKKRGPRIPARAPAGRGIAPSNRSGARRR